MGPADGIHLGACSSRRGDQTEGTKKGIHSYLLGHTRIPLFAKGLDCRLDDSQRYIQPHTEELRPRLGLVESFVQQPSEVYQEYTATIAIQVQIDL